jgi:heme-degrading monooxygenase HmoA
MSVVSVLRIPLRPGAVADLARLFVELDVLGHSERSGGFLGGRLLKPLAEGDHALVIAEWETAEDYQGWLDNPVRESLREHIEPLLADDVAAGLLYEEVSIQGEEHA